MAHAAAGKTELVAHSAVAKCYAGDARGYRAPVAVGGALHPVGRRAIAAELASLAVPSL